MLRNRLKQALKEALRKGQWVTVNSSVSNLTARARRFSQAPNRP